MGEKFIIISGLVNVQQGRRCAEEACEAVLVLRERAKDKADPVLLNVY